MAHKTSAELTENAEGNSHGCRAHSLCPPSCKQGPHLAQLHEAIHDAQKVAAGQCGARVAAGHVLLVQLALALGQPGDMGAVNGALVRPMIRAMQALRIAAIAGEQMRTTTPTALHTVPS